MQPTQPCILHAIDTTGPGGAETVFLDLVQLLQVPGYRNIALIKGPGWVEDQLKKRGVNYYTLKPRGFLSIPYYIHIIQLIKSQQVELVQANLLGSTLSFAIITSLLKIPMVATLHGRVDISPKERFIRIKNWLMRRGVDQLVAVSDDLRHFIAERKLFPANAIATIYNGISAARYQSARGVNLRAQLNLPAGSRMVGCIGNVRPAKDYGTLIRAASIVIRAYPNVHFCIAGHAKADLKAELMRLVDGLNLRENVHFLGFLDDTPSFLNELDLFALSSISEGFSIATLEAMASGLPVVATRCGGPEEIITHGQDGLLVPARNPEALAAALLELLTPNNMVISLQNNARTTVLIRFSIETMLDRYRSIYQRLLTSNAKAE